MTDLILLWHRRDLRIRDQSGLAIAQQQNARIVGVFCLDPQILERDDIAAARVVYLLDSLQELAISYQKAGSQLIVLHGQPTQVLPQLARELQVKSVVWARDVEPYARQRDRQVAEALKTEGISVTAVWDQLLHSPGEVMTGNGTPYTVYTPFWRNWVSQDKQDPLSTDIAMAGLTEAEQETAEQAGAILSTANGLNLPSAQDLGFDWQGELLLAPGEQSAHDQLDWFCDRAIASYDEQRNFPAILGTSQLSAALKFGTLGIRTVWQVAQLMKDQSRSDEMRNNIQTWQQELAWREFYQHALYFFPELADGPYREPFKDFPWENNVEHFQAWCEGKTGYPIVDAAMRQLNETGWMHNRCRMIVASFLTKDLMIDWRWGEKYFMQRLVDGDLAANNGGWQWSASSGMDPKPLRIFNPASQAKKFDPDAEYIRQWVPEIRSLDTGELVTGSIAPLDCDRCGYPQPIVDHNLQQKRFREIYKQQKNKVG